MPGTRKCSRRVARRLHVEVVQGNDAIDDLSLRQVADSQQYILQLPRLVFVGNIEDVVE